MKHLLSLLIIFCNTIAQAQNIGIGVAAPREKLEINGGLIIGNTSNTNAGTIRYNNTNNDIEFRDNTGWNGVKNKYYTFSAYNLEDTSRNKLIDFPQSNITVAETGVYLINYYVDAYNTFYLAGSNSADIQEKTVYQTDVSLYNKTVNTQYQKQRIDFLDYYYDYSGAAMYSEQKLPAHQVSGVTVQQLSVNDIIGFKMYQTTDTNGKGAMRIRQCTVTLVKLY